MRGLCKIIGFYMIMLVITIMSLVCISDGVCQAKVKSDKCKTKKINLRVSETYKIRYKKNAKYITSRPKVASVSKKGLIKAKKNGRCVIKVMAKKKCVSKIKVTVCNDKREEIHDSSSVNQDMNNVNVTDNTGHNNSNQVSCPPGTYPDNFVYGNNNMTLLEIEKIDDNNVYYIFDSREWHWSIAGGLDNICKYIKLRINKDDIKIDISVGDKVNVYIVSEYMIVGENAIFETGLINISPIPEKQTNTTS